MPLDKASVVDAAASSQAESKTHSDAPPESPSSIWTRRLILIAFWAVVVLLGLPHWTWTTSIHRSALPQEQMLAWSEGRACDLSYPISVRLAVDGLSENEQQQLRIAVQNRLNSLQQLPLLNFDVKSPTTSPGGDKQSATPDADLNVSVTVERSGDSSSVNLESWPPILNIKVNANSPDVLIKHVSDGIGSLFTDEAAALVHSLEQTPYRRYLEGFSLDAEQRLQLDRRTTRTFKYASAYHLTFSLFTASNTPSAWEIENALSTYITPLVQSLSSISDFSFDSQVQLFATISPSVSGPMYNNNTRSWVLKHEDLTGFVNAAEWPLSPSIGEGATVNFVLYVPSADQSPLVIEDNGGADWIIPQWGGVQIHNPGVKNEGTLSVSDLKTNMITFAEQLTLLLGVPSTPAPLPLRIASLKRERATSLIVSASSTLGALARLTQKLTSIAIPDTVAKSVDETVQHLDKACANIASGKYDLALQNARVAQAEAEKAFFEPSMVGQVYFPEEHKVAVYVPLLGPMAVPLVMVGIKELRKLRQKSKTKTN